MELKLDQYEYKGRRIQSPTIPSGLTVNLSCFSHLNDSSDIPVKFHLQYGSTTHSVTCPANGTKCFEIPELKWSVCRNETEPHNCILVLHEFGDSDDGSYSCSTTIGGREVRSNRLELQALSTFKPAESAHKGSKIILALSIAAVALIILVILGVFLFRYRKTQQRRGT